MRAVKYFVLALVAVSFITLGSFYADEKDKPKYTIKEVMKMAHKEGLLKKVVSGKGDKADTEKLVELYVALCQNKPPKGDAEAWVKKCKAIVKAAEGVAEGNKKAKGALRKSTNCKGCHSVFK